MLDLFNIPTPQQSNYQAFYGGTVSGNTIRTWVKPRGASMVRIMLIGAGGSGGQGTSSNGGGGGGSGAITSWIGPAMFVPDILNIRVGSGGANDLSGDPCLIYYRSSNGENLILRANAGERGAISGGAGGTAMTANQFTACGIFTSIAGQAGTAGGSTAGGLNVGVSGTTFLSGGAGGSGAAASTGGRVTPNYGYPVLPNTTAGGTVKGADGYFIQQPILVGTGGAGGTTTGTAGTVGGNGGIGCGGGGSGEDASAGSRGGDGVVFIWSW
jgi:hypothetical protein